MKTPDVANLLGGRSSPVPVEEFIPLLQGGSFRMEQIISHGQPTPAGQWYDQADPEWVMLMRGAATLRFEDGRLLALVAGDHLVIPARQKHRVDACSHDAIWLAVHYKG